MVLDSIKYRGSCVALSELWEYLPTLRLMIGLAEHFLQPVNSFKYLHFKVSQYDKQRHVRRTVIRDFLNYINYSHFFSSARRFYPYL